MTEFHLFHAHAAGDQASARLGVTMGGRKTLIPRERITVNRAESEDQGQWILLTITGILPKPLQTWGIYAPAGKVLTRRKWMQDFTQQIQRHKGYRVIAGDFNFVTDIFHDKIGGNPDKGDGGKEIQEDWGNKYKITDAWREENPDTIATTWCNNLQGSQRVRTRIDKALIDDRLLNKLSNLDIKRTKVSDHDAITWTIQTTQKNRKSPYAKLPLNMLKSTAWLEQHRQIYEEEHNNPDIIEGYENYKKRIVTAALQIQRKENKKKTRDRSLILQEIDLMRKIVRWAENAAAKIERNKKVPRWER